MAEVSAAASHSHSECSPCKDCYEGETCFVCSGVILEADVERDGEIFHLLVSFHFFTAFSSDSYRI